MTNVVGESLCDGKLLKAALKEPNMNNPRRQPGVTANLLIQSPEGA